MLGLIVASYCYETFPDFAEGKLAKVRSAVVNARVLAQVAGRLGVGEVLLLGRGEEGSGGRTKASILADAFEAILGAVYLDAGWDAARALVLRELGDAIGRAGEEPDDFDHKKPAAGKAVRDGDRTPPCVVVGSGRTTTGPTWPRCIWAGRAGGPAKGAPRRTPSRRLPARPGAQQCLSCPRSRRCARTWRREVVGKKIKTVAVSNLSARCGCGTPRPSTSARPLGGPHDQVGGAAGQVPAADAGRREHAGGASRDERARCCG